MNHPCYYYLGLGSNLLPASNIARALNLLQAQFAQLLVWPVIETVPADIETNHHFYNTLVIISSNLPPKQLKQTLNDMEKRLGRDRSDPASSEKDRTIDIDILAQQSELNFAITEQFTEPYVRQVLTAGSKPNGQCREISIEGQSLQNEASTLIDGHKLHNSFIIEDGISVLFERFRELSQVKVTDLAK
ncbi:2-amino-4-hydroxy-6-hydroxymethyldihydropteridine diphosphokinase [Aliidiomarina minuta]|uniref:2-amino-4-hydroxy-6-hydroxymethyldihydropteridine pyrophosphokinase n=1 Tax=Aliidiomarina minuta TaxID=880057 RepID=A0A432W862_9GAMM|nr:2-amino-4-hydroxy-6-hydroxymethyldihydropteridine diphosphokinase [Aliidiomarina minuta]RUO26146.1 2-amino-4-hydroxy-6-hydroxymethyldihydropteridine diphosphokinase [Aliidiomarina minuta]